MIAHEIAHIEDLLAAALAREQVALEHSKAKLKPTLTVPEIGEAGAVRGVLSSHRQLLLFS
jgi:hypothetical protein